MCFLYQISSVEFYRQRAFLHVTFSYPRTKKQNITYAKTSDRLYFGGEEMLLLFPAIVNWFYSINVLTVFFSSFLHEVPIDKAIEEELEVIEWKLYGPLILYWK